jgi:Cu/Ag efflux protein CusF
MNRRTTTSRIIAVSIFLAACLVFTPAKVKAHGDLLHVIGIIAKVSDTGVSVKTKEGKIIEVQFGEKTTYFRAKVAIDKGRIKVGDRIVIHAAKVNDKLVAHTVEIGTTAAPALKGTK